VEDVKPRINLTMKNVMTELNEGETTNKMKEGGGVYNPYERFL